MCVTSDHNHAPAPYTHVLHPHTLGACAVAMATLLMAVASYRDYEREAHQLVRQLLESSLERVLREQRHSQVFCIGVVCVGRFTSHDKVFACSCSLRRRHGHWGLTLL